MHLAQHYKLPLKQDLTCLIWRLISRKSWHLTRHLTPGKSHQSTYHQANMTQYSKQDKSFPSIAAMETPVLIDDALLHCFGLLLLERAWKLKSITPLYPLLYRKVYYLTTMKMLFVESRKCSRRLQLSVLLGVVAVIWGFKLLQIQSVNAIILGFQCGNHIETLQNTNTKIRPLIPCLNKTSHILPANTRLKHVWHPMEEPIISTYYTWK